MKTLRITLVIVSLIVLRTMSWAAPSIISQGDSTIITDGKDTVTVVADLNGLKAKVNGVLNDTLLELGDVADANNEADEAIDPEVAQASHERMLDHERVWADLAKDVTTSCVIGVVLIVLLALLFSYMRRRRKYRMVERAIENNYPLPPYVFGVPQETVRTVYVNAPSVPDAGNQASAPLNQGKPLPVKMTGNGAINWHALKGGFTLAAIGFGLMMFFIIAGGEAMAGACSILLLLGLGKMWLAYQDQMTAIAYMPPVPQQPDVPQPPQNATVTSQPENNPQPETPQPPVFNGGQPQA